MQPGREPRPGTAAARPADPGAEVEAARRAYEEALARYREALAQSPEREGLFTTLSGLPVEPVYTPSQPDPDYLAKLGFPGEYPFTRGIHATMYRGRLWTIRQFAGFGTASETNARFKYLLEQGQTGLSVAFDMPTLLGYDSDHPRSLGEVGREGVAIDSLEDMETLFEGIPLDQVSTSMTINGPAAILWAMYLVTAEKQGVSLARLRGTIQNDILKEYMAQKEWIFPPEPSVKLVVDTIEFGSQHVPQWNPISISGYHIREAGSTAVQELAFTLANGFHYVEACLQRGLAIDQFAPRLSFFFNSHLDFFEEIAKFRAARRIWARAMRERYGAQDPRSWRLRFHTQTAGCSLTAQQPEVNLIRTAYQALAAVLGGTQSLHTNALDEVYCLPTEHAATLAVRTQQVLAYEIGVVNSADPLGGSYLVEALTDQLEAEAEKYFRQIEALGGVIAGIESGFFQKEIAEAAYRYQREVEAGRRIVVGVNAFRQEEDRPPEIFRIRPEVEADQIARLRRLRARRDQGAVTGALAKLRQAARRGANLMPYLMEAARCYATVGEIADTLREVYGEYQERAVI